MMEQHIARVSEARKKPSAGRRPNMNEIAKLAIDAHGGLDRWKRFSTLSVHGINGGLLWGAKGKAGVLDDVTITVDLRNERASHWPFGSADRRSRFEPQRVALENAKDGKVLEELLQPRTSFQGHTLETPWSDLQHTSLGARCGRI